MSSINGIITDTECYIMSQINAIYYSLKTLNGIDFFFAPNLSSTSASTIICRVVNTSEGFRITYNNKSLVRGGDGLVEFSSSTRFITFMYNKCDLQRIVVLGQNMILFDRNQSIQFGCRYDIDQTNSFYTSTIFLVSKRAYFEQNCKTLYDGATLFAYSEDSQFRGNYFVDEQLCQSQALLGCCQEGYECGYCIGNCSGNNCGYNNLGQVGCGAPFNGLNIVIPALFMIIALFILVISLSTIFFGKQK